MTRSPDSDPRPLSALEQRALASFLAGRLPAGQLQAELARARGCAVPVAVAHSAQPLPALHAA